MSLWHQPHQPAAWSTRKYSVESLSSTGSPLALTRLPSSAFVKRVPTSSGWLSTRSRTRSTKSVYEISKYERSTGPLSGIAAYMPNIVAPLRVATMRPGMNSVPTGWETPLS